MENCENNTQAQQPEQKKKSWGKRIWKACEITLVAGAVVVLATKTETGKKLTGKCVETFKGLINRNKNNEPAETVTVEETTTITTEYDRPEREVSRPREDWRNNNYRNANNKYMKN